MRKILLPLLFLAPMLLVGKSKRPNILFMFTDDHSPLAISAYGSKINKTPHMDRIAQEGMRFRKCYVTNSISGQAAR